MSDYEHLEHELSKKLKQKDRRQKPKMKVTGRRVLELKRIISQKAKT